MKLLMILFKISNNNSFLTLGMLSKRYHNIEAKLLESDIILPSNIDLVVLNSDQISEIFRDDVSYTEF
jgi:hypothetical protein